MFYSGDGRVKTSGVRLREGSWEGMSLAGIRDLRDLIGEIDWTRCSHGGAHRSLDMFRGENRTCYVCFDRGRSWAEKYHEKLKGSNPKCQDAHREEK